MTNFATIAPTDANPDGLDASEAVQAVQQSQEVYARIFAELRDTSWPDSPSGPLAHHWNSATGQSATYLVILAWNLNRLLLGASAEDKDVLWPKFRSLFYAISELQFEEVLVELEIGAELTRIARPLYLESLVDPTRRNSAKKPSSPDYALYYDKNPLMIEATVWHWEAFHAWWRLQSVIREHYENLHLKKRKISCDMRLSLPVMAGMGKVARARLTDNALTRQVLEEPSGNLTVDVGCTGPAILEWSKAVNVIEFDEQTGPRSRVITPDSPEWGNHLMFAWNFNEAFTEADLDEALKSLMKTIDRKKRQSVVGQPFVLAIGLHSAKMSWELLSPIIKQRIWPNPKYKWLSGILQHHPVRYLPPEQNLINLSVNVNPNALHPIPRALLDAEHSGPATG